MLTLERIPTTESLCHNHSHSTSHSIHSGGASLRPVNTYDCDRRLETVEKGKVPNHDEEVKGDGLQGVGDDEPIEYPEGGVKAWLVVLGSFISMLAAVGFMNAMGSIQSYILQNQLSNFSESQVSWIFSVWLFCMYTGSVQVGPLFDAYGIRVLIIPGMIVFVVSIMIVSVCKQYWHFILGYSLLGGISAAMIFNPSVTVVGHYFYKRRAFATGIALSGGAVGGVLFPLIIPRLFASVGYAWGMRIVGFICLGFLIPGCCLVDARKLRKKGAASQPVCDFKALKDIQFLFTSLGLFALEWAFFAPLSYIVLFAEAQGSSPEYANSLVAIANGVSVAGRALPSYFGDKYGVFNTAITMNTIAGIFTLTVWLTVGTTHSGLIAYTVLYGFFSGAAAAVIPSCIGRISDTRQYGTRYGTSYFVASVATLTGLPICGALRGNNYQGTIIFTGVTFLAAGLCYLVARVAHGTYRVARF